MATNVLISCPEDCVVFKFKVKEGSVVNSGTILCEYKLLNAKKIGKLKCNCNGTVRDLLVHEGDETQIGKPVVSIELCRHLTVWRNMCAECGLDLRELESLNASVAMEHMIPDLLISEKRAQVLGKEDELRLLRNRQLVLLVDLDQTLIHTTNDAIPPNLKDVYHFQLWPHPAWYHTKFRPHTERFLERISRLYELHICTFGTRTYAHTIARFLDPDGHYFSQRILSRDECFHPTLKTSNLKALFPCGDTMVCIIDDREDVWKMAPNLVHVRPYRFFDGTADINAPPEASKAGTPASAEDDGNTVGKVVHHSAKLVRVPKKKTVVAAATVSGEPPASGTEPNKPTEVTGNGLDGNILASEGPEAKEADVQSEPAVQTKPGCSDATVETSTNMSAKIAAQELPEQDAANQNKNESAFKLPGQTGKDDESTQSRNGNKDMEVSDKATVEVEQVKCESQSSNNNNGNNACNFETADNDKPLSESEDGVGRSDKMAMAACSSNMPTSEAAPIEVNTTNAENTQQVVKPPDVVDDEEYEEMIEWEDLDDYLIYLEDVLTRIHTAYYKVFDQMQQATESDELCETPDLKTIVPYVRRKVLKGARIVFSGVCPLNTDPSACRIYRIAESLGALVQNEIVLPRKYGEVESTTHMVAARLGTQKVRAALRVKGVKIVNPDWLWTCADRWEWVDERLFPLNDETSSHFLSRDSPDPSVRKKEGSSATEQGKAESSAAAAQTKPQSYDAQIDLSRFPDSQFFNPLAMLSKKEISGMYAEVDEDEDSDDDDVKNGVHKHAEDEGTNDAEEDSSSEDEEVLRQKVLMSFMRNKRKCEESSDEDSLAGDFPKGWKKAEKKRQKIEEGEELEDEEDGEKLPDPDYGNDSSNDASKSSKSNDDDFSDSVGSVDDEIAAAVEREFLS